MDASSESSSDSISKLLVRKHLPTNRIIINVDEKFAPVDKAH